MSERDDVQRQLDQAWQNFNYATGEFIDTAIYGLKTAEERFNSIRREGYEEIRHKFGNTTVCASC
jgi:hypothetical protein